MVHIVSWLPSKKGARGDQASISNLRTGLSAGPIITSRLPPFGPGYKQPTGLFALRLSVTLGELGLDLGELLLGNRVEGDDDGGDHEADQRHETSGQAQVLGNGRVLSHVHASLVAGEGQDGWAKPGGQSAEHLAEEAQASHGGTISALAGLPLVVLNGVAFHAPHVVAAELGTNGVEGQAHERQPHVVHEDEHHTTDDAEGAAEVPAALLAEVTGDDRAERGGDHADGGVDQGDERGDQGQSAGIGTVGENFLGDDRSDGAHAGGDQISRP